MILTKKKKTKCKARGEGGWDGEEQSEMNASN